MSEAKRTRAFAQVQMVVNITLDQPWGPEATITEIQKRAAEQARELCVRLTGSGRIDSVISTKVKAVIVEEE